MPRWTQCTFGFLIAVLIVAAPWAYAKQRHSDLRNFCVVRQGVLYRSGQLSLNGLKQVIRDYQIQTVVTLRDAQTPEELPPDHEEEHYCKQHGIRHVRLPQRPWQGADGTAPNEVNVIQFVELMQNPANHPVLIHCLAGKHRTGAMCAVFRMEHDRWSNERAIREMAIYGYDNIDEHPDLLGFLTKYRPTWRE